MNRDRKFEMKVHIDCEPHWTLDETLQEVRSVVTLFKNRIPQVPAMDVVIHFPDELFQEGEFDDLPF